jgi:hypothetical protein
MKTVSATWKNGQVVLDEQPDWPDGRRLVIEPKLEPESIGMTEDEQGDDPESIARWIADFEAIPLLVLPATVTGRRAPWISSGESP